jgi:hypothetical protein
MGIFGKGLPYVAIAFLAKTSSPSHFLKPRKAENGIGYSKVFGARPQMEKESTEAIELEERKGVSYLHLHGVTWRHLLSLLLSAPKDTTLTTSSLCEVRMSVV